ncbi:MAG TPA: AMP-binding protein [Acidimicrobiales bacterium]|nr:AMP-binding protein [Acidimicrobiales bacterium]
MSTPTGSSSARRSAPALVLERAESSPRSVAMRVLESGVWVEYGWADVARTVARVAGLLGQADVGAGSVVAVACGSRSEWALCVWAVHALGASAVTVTTQADDGVLRAVSDRSPAVWIVEGAEPVDRLEQLGRPAENVLTIDDIHGGTQPRWSWQADVLGADAADDELRLAELRRAVDGLDGASEALRTPEDGDHALTHDELVAAGGSAHLGLEPTDEYLAFLPPTWPSEAVVLLGAHPVSGAVVNSGSRGASGLLEFRAVQPTVLHAPSEWWDAVAGRILMIAAEPGPFAKGAMKGLVEGKGGLTSGLARRVLTRRMGLSRVRVARSLGPIGPSTTKVLTGLGITLADDLARPKGLTDGTESATEESRQENLEGAT